MSACAALLFAACGSDDDWNTDGDVTVELAKATIEIKENASMFYVPLQVNGTTNGPIRVTVDLTENSESPAVEDEHYILTSKTVVIPDNETEVSLEFSLTNDMEINDNRLFTITIVNVEGAKIGEQNKTAVTIVDDDSMFYEAIQGAWSFNFVDGFDGTEDSFSLKIVGVQEGQAGYEKTLYISGFAGRSDLIAEAGYNYDEATKEVTLDFELGQFMGKYGSYQIYLFGVTPDGYIADSGFVTAKVNTNMREITFDSDDELFLGAPSGNQVLGLAYCTQITMTR